MKLRSITVAIAALAIASIALPPAAITQTPVFHHTKKKSADPEGPWTSVPNGFAAAKRENKPIIVDVYTDWCGWCKRMEQTTFHDPELMRLMTSNFILVRANAEDGGPGQRLADANRITGYPTILLFAPSGEHRATLVGYQQVAPFTAKLNAFLEGKPVPGDEEQN